MNTELTVQNDLVVEIKYVLKDSSDQLIDSSDKAGAPMPYIHGKQNILPKLENELTGKKIGDSFSLEIASADAYGDREDKMVQSVPKTQFPKPEEIQVGMHFQVQTEQGNPLPVVVVEIQDEHIVLDGNHPLAGVDLKFEVEVAAIRVATAEELQHGHVHTDGGSCGSHAEEATEKADKTGDDDCCGSCS